MTWFGWLVSFLGVGGVVAIGAGFFFAPAATLAFLRAAVGFVVDVAGFVLEKLRAVVAWARDPKRNWWKIGCVSLASVCALLSWYADGQRREVLSTITHYETVVLPPIKKQAETATANYDALLVCRKALADEVGLQEDIERQNREAVAAAQAVAQRAEAELVEWRRRARSVDCTAALAALEGKCASFSDY